MRVDSNTKVFMDDVRFGWTPKSSQRHTFLLTQKEKKGVLQLRVLNHRTMFSDR